MFIRSRILIYYPSRIPDLGSRIQKSQQKREVKKICCHTFFCNHKFHKIENCFIFEMLKKKMWPHFQGLIELFTQKSGFGIRVQWSKRHRIRNTVHNWLWRHNLTLTSSLESDIFTWLWQERCRRLVMSRSTCRITWSPSYLQNKLTNTFKCRLWSTLENKSAFTSNSEIL